MRSKRIIGTLVSAVLVGSLASPLSAHATEAPALSSRIAATAQVRSVDAASGKIARLAGKTRYETAIAISGQYAANVKAVFLATGADFPDALSATAAAARLGAPVLLTQRDGLLPETMAELQRLKPKNVYVLGGPTVVSDAVLRQAQKIAPAQRVYGADRYETSRRIAAKFFPQAASIVIATGLGYADALVAGAAAGAQGVPTILVRGNVGTLDAPTMSMMNAAGVTQVTIAGSHGAVSIGIEQQLRTAKYAVARHGGASRYETAAKLMAAFHPEPTDPVYIATGDDFPDALAMGALAALRSGPLSLVRSGCMPEAAATQMGSAVVATRVVAGGPAVVSDAAAAGVSCGDGIKPIGSWRTSGFTFRTDVAVPYADRPTVNVNDPAIKVDSTGLRVYNRLDNGQRADHPVAYAQYGLSALQEYQRTGAKVWLDRAVRHAERLIEMHTERDGAWFYPYLFPWTYPGANISAPWWSMMGQGQALSLFTRLNEQTGQQKWRDAADATWASFTLPRSGAEPWGTLSVDGRLWFEEYAATVPPLLVLNGQIFAMFGLYDYYRLTGSANVAKYLDGGATAVLEVMPKIRVPGGVSYYCWASICPSKTWQNGSYHPIHIWQLDTLARLTGDARFTQWANTLRSDRPTTPRSDVAFEPGPLTVFESEDDEQD